MLKNLGDKLSIRIDDRRTIITDLDGTPVEFVGEWEDLEKKYYKEMKGWLIV